MEIKLSTRFKHAWNGFMNRDPTPSLYEYGSSYRPDRRRMTRGNERSIITSVFNRIAIDVAALKYQHVLLDDKKRYKQEKDSSLNYCLTVGANIDQSSRSFIQDIVMSMFDEGCIAVAPIDTDINPDKTELYDIESMRVCKILEWFPQHVLLRAYNDRTGKYENLYYNKKDVAIIENPLYSIINEPNSTVQRLIRKLNLLDVIDEQSGSGKLDLIIQLPYVIKSDMRRNQAEKRRRDIENQLANSKFGVAYTDATERITQLNRPVENNLMNQVKYLTDLAFSQLGITQTILDGTADEQTMLNYYNNTIEPIASTIVDELKRKFIAKSALNKTETIMVIRDPFRLVPVSQIAEIADKFTRNEIASSNEVRQILMWTPSDDPKADELRNKNLSEPNGGKPPELSQDNNNKEENQNE